MRSECALRCLRWILLALAVSCVAAADSRPRVLILFSNDRLLPANQELELGLREALAGHGAPLPHGDRPNVDLLGEFLDSIRFPEAEQESAMERFLGERHRSHRPDVVVAAGPQALHFMMRRREALFPGVPLVFCGVSPSQVQELDPADNIAGRPMEWSIAPLLESLPTIRPGIRKILLVVGSTQFDENLYQDALGKIDPFRSRYEFEASRGENLEDLLDRVSNLPNDTLVFYLSYFSTPDGQTMVPQDVAGRLATASRVPVICVYDTYIGGGVLGGSVVPFREEGYFLGQLVKQVLDAGSAREVGILPPGKPRLVFDGRALRRFAWAPASLPPEAEIRHRPQSLWEAHRKSVLLGSGAILLQSALIVGLVGARIRQRRAEKGRQQSESRFTGVFRGSPASISIIRQSDGRIIDVNPAWERITGVTREHALGRSHLELGFKFEDSGKGQTFPDCLAANSPLRGFEQRLRLPKGESRLLSLSTELVNLNGEACYITMAQDITDRREAAEARQKLQHASRLGMLGELAASIAHEVNQPLGAILSNADAASMLLELPEPPIHEIREILSDIRRDDLRASGVISQVRSMITKGESQMIALDPAELAEGVAAIVRPDCLRRLIDFECDIAQDLPMICGEKGRIEQVLLNLLLNAMDTLKPIEPHLRKIRMAVGLAAHGMIEISVTDTGPGIPPDLMERIFENFFSTKSEGMGLGLALSRSIAESHGGQLIAGNSPGAGAIFRLTLPSIR
jgi:PAS domain S-box-containing protein